MNKKLFKLSRPYREALRKHLKQGPTASPESARGLGGRALAAGLQTLELAKLHEETLITEILPGRTAAERAALIRQAGVFFATAVLPIPETHENAHKNAALLKKFVETLSRRTVELAASNGELNREIAQRKAIEKALKKSERHYSQLLKQSARLQEQLRWLSRQILSAQEEERKKISRELHDVIAQTLTGINLRLASLKNEAMRDAKGLSRNINHTQRLVEKSVGIVHRFARELRPALLDDLGLIPALHSLMKSFTTRTGIRTQLTAFAGIEQLDAARRTVLYRVVQEALTNVARHAQASKAEVRIQKLGGGICMKIKDNGKSFRSETVLLGRGNKRLGLLGMRERLEMIGGSFDVDSTPGNGTTIIAQIHSTKTPRATRTKDKL